MDKQIEEMSNLIYATIWDYLADGLSCKAVCDLLAKDLLKSYQPKIPEGSVVLTRKEYDELQKGIKTYNYTAVITEQEQERWVEGYKLGFKEGVQALQIQTKKMLDKVCKELQGDNYD